MKLKNIIKIILCNISFILLSNYAKADVAPQKIPDVVSLYRLADGKKTLVKQYKYEYSLNNQLKSIKSLNNDLSITYTYNGKNQIIKVRIVFSDNTYVETNYTYNVKNEIIKIVRTGLQSETILPRYDAKNKYYNWIDSRKREHKLAASYYNGEINSHSIGGSKFEFIYDKLSTNGLSKIPVKITIPTYLAMDFINTDWYENGFFQCVFSSPLKELKDPRENGKNYSFSNAKDKYTYLESSTFRTNNTNYALQYSYRDLSKSPVVIDKIKVDQKINIKTKGAK